MWRVALPAHSVGMRNVVKISPIRLYNITAKRGETHEVQPSIATAFAEGRCKDTGKMHSWKPTQISATQGDYMSVSFVCRHCKERAGNFITLEQYELHAENLERECEL